MDFIHQTLPLLAIGCASGFMAGLLGVGGGVIMVPLLLMVYHSLGVPSAHQMPLALGTSLATIMVTSISSARSHHQRGGVVWGMVWKLAPGVVAGSFIGAQVAPRLPPTGLKVFFAVFLLSVAIDLVLPKKEKSPKEWPLPAWLAVGLVIGIVSGLVGIGGGSLTVPFLIFMGLAAGRAVGTSSAVGFPIAVSSTIGYILSGWNTAGLPDHHLGYVWLPGFLILGGMSILFAPMGARLAHRLPVPVLKRVFAAFLVVVAGKIIIGLL